MLFIPKHHGPRTRARKYEGFDVFNFTPEVFTCRSHTCARLMSVAAFDLAAASSFCRSDSC